MYESDSDDEAITQLTTSKITYDQPPANTAEFTARSQWLRACFKDINLPNSLRTAFEVYTSAADLNALKAILIEQELDKNLSIVTAR